MASVTVDGVERRHPLHSRRLGGQQRKMVEVGKPQIQSWNPSLLCNQPMILWRAFQLIEHVNLVQDVGCVSPPNTYGLELASFGQSHLKPLQTA